MLIIYGCTKLNVLSHSVLLVTAINLIVKKLQSFCFGFYKNITITDVGCCSKLYYLIAFDEGQVSDACVVPPSSYRTSATSLLLIFVHFGSKTLE